MYTGIVQGQCDVIDVKINEGVGTITVDMGGHDDDLELGASVAHNGVCLTVTRIDGPKVEFNVIGETFASTNLGTLQPGDKVNIERSLKFGDELGGHMLSGHIAGTVTVAEIEADGDNRTMWFDVDPAHMPYLLWKGWAALDGASLTISRLDRDANRIAVSLIPETLARTSLGTVEVGDKVNLELDGQVQAIVETVQNVLRDPDLRTQVLGLN